MSYIPLEDYVSSSIKQKAKRIYTKSFSSDISPSMSDSDDHVDSITYSYPTTSYPKLSTQSDSFPTTVYPESNSDSISNVALSRYMYSECNQPYISPIQPPLYSSCYQKPNLPVTYQPTLARVPIENGIVVPMTGSNPIRGMATSVYQNICSQYGTSSVQVNALDYYGGTQWCQVGILMNNHLHPNSVYALEARFIGNSWEFRARDALVNLHIYLHTIGTGPYGAYRNNDKIELPGKEGIWTIQIQTQHQPYLLHVPV